MCGPNLSPEGTHPGLEVHGRPPVQQECRHVHVPIVCCDVQRREAALEEKSQQTDGIRRERKEENLVPTARGDT